MKTVLFITLGVIALILIIGLIQRSRRKRIVIPEPINYKQILDPTNFGGSQISNEPTQNEFPVTPEKPEEEQVSMKIKEEPHIEKEDLKTDESLPKEKPAPKKKAPAKKTSTEKVPAKKAPVKKTTPKKPSTEKKATTAKKTQTKQK